MENMIFDESERSEEYYEAEYGSRPELAEDFLDFPDENEHDIVAQSNYPDWMYPNDHEYERIA